ncbi:MAG TPA: aminotransferase class I/II-fold pyridoxal phosphate-dependent enzyme, partial [Solirubrobacteraceae bacterium]|nr:aminotransferase class I/II-fold pyridoxal phosphate-dependent enzyme [Solirubrobacteraceae bacterium]
ALGGYGAYVCASGEMVRYLINTARALIFSTAPAPPAVAAAGAALALLEAEPERVRTLRARARTLRGALAGEGWDVRETDMHIVPLLVGDERRAVALCEAALQGGVYAQAIRAPSVPAGAARLRLTAMATHSVEELRRAARVLSEAARALGSAPAAFSGAAGSGPLSHAA